MFEMKVVLATILLRYQMGLADNRPLRYAVRRITLAPAEDLKMVVLGRTERQELSLSASAK
jgi:cytochrome P450 family 110